MKNKMNFFSKIAKSTYHFKSYNYFVRESLGKAMLYLVLLVLLTTTIYTIKLGIEIKDGVDVIATELSDELPDFEIVEGVLKVDESEKMPIVHEFNENGKKGNIIVDTTNLTDENILADYDYGMILYSDRFVMKDSTGKITKENFKTVGIKNFAKADLNTIASDAFRFIFGMYAIFAPIVYFLGYCIQVFVVLGLVGLLIAKILNTKLTYGQACSLAIYSLTIQMIVSTIAKFAGLNLRLLMIIPISIIYLFFAIKAIDFEDYQDYDFDIK